MASRAAEVAVLSGALLPALVVALDRGVAAFAPGVAALFVRPRAGLANDVVPRLRGRRDGRRDAGCFPLDDAVVGVFTPGLCSSADAVVQAGCSRTNRVESLPNTGFYSAKDR